MIGLYSFSLLYPALIIGTVSTSILVKKAIECEQYDPKNCENGTVCETKIEKCEIDSDKPSHCYVLWSNITGLANMKGCFTDNVACYQPECVDTNPEMRSSSLNFCCCNIPMCNSKFRWEPNITKTAEVEAPKQEFPNDTAIIFTAICAVLAFVTLTSIGLFFYKRRKQAMFNEIPTIEPEVTSSSPCLAIRPITLIEMKARGRFGAVWQGLMKADEVAVKIFPMQEKDSWMSEQEIYKLPRMKHPNILEFIGAEKHMDKIHPEFWLITAYHSYGSLCDYLKANTVTWMQLCKIAESMSRGLMHLHEEILPSKADGLKPAIAHRDFKSKNVLLKTDLTACIADFGLAMVFQPGKPCGDTHGQVGTRRYMAPEVLEGAINFTRDAFLRIDVYACGLVLWEMVSRCNAHTGIVNEYSLPFEAELGLNPSLETMQENVVMKKLRPRIYEHWRSHTGLNAICDTMEECWDHDAEARLSSSCVMERVSQHTKYPQTQLLIETNTDTTPLKGPSDSM